MTAQEKMDHSLYNYDTEQVKQRIRQLMQEMGVKEYKEASAATETR